ncbi:hypothetical protein PIROE2DRAFT_7303 [Piromyces sp. E2]|nr:hypothetical protein PIROE2DRAFT_7303 [Piromyces sp. E2]|eukprot:OUM65637.1 hypothetical protein PIROE2DRAFT_7303 [Piromyces sp. E2]
MNYLQIFANPNEYIMEPVIENYNGKIQFNFTKIDITITDCKENQLKRLMKNNLYYCENPKCESSCPIDTSAICKLNSEFENNPHKNICQCLAGYEGENCETKIFLNYKKQGIVRDIGYFKILFFCLALILLQISYFFSTYGSYLEYSIKYLTKNIGGFNILVIFYIDITLAYELGVPSNSHEGKEGISKFNMILSFCTESLSSTKKLNTSMDDNTPLSSTTSINFNDHINVLNVRSNSMDEPKSSCFVKNNLCKERLYSSLDGNVNINKPDINKKGNYLLDQSKNNGKNKSNINYSFNNIADSSPDEENKDMMKLKILENLKKNIKNAHRLYIKIIILNLIVVTITILTVFIYSLNKYKKLIQIDTGEWYYNYDLEIINFIYDSYAIIFIILIIIKGKKILEYDCTFNYTRYIVCISIIEIVLGPTVRVRKCLAIDVYIPNETYTIYNLTDIIKKYSLKSNVINVYLTEEYIESNLPSRKGYQIDIPENIDFSLYGKENHGTVINFEKNSFFYSINFLKYTGQKVRIENIKFYGFTNPFRKDSVFFTNASDSNFSIIVKNCTFEKSDGKFIIVDPENSHVMKNNSNETQLIIDSCKFIDNKSPNLIHITDENGESLNHPFNFLITNSEFNNCDSILKISFGKIVFDNLYKTYKGSFSKISSLTEKASFVYLKTYGRLFIENSIFTDFEADDSIVPFIKTSGSLIKFQNVTMRNVHNKVGHLIYDIADGTKYSNQIYISDSHFKGIINNHNNKNKNN